MVARTLMAGTLLNRVARIRVALTMEIHPVVVLHGSGAVRLNLPASSVDTLVGTGVQHHRQGPCHVHESFRDGPTG